MVASTHEADRGRQPRGLMIAGGALAVVMVAAMVVALTPRQTASTATSITATTVPTAASLSDAVNTAVVAAESIRKGPLAGITGIPQAIADVPALSSRSAATGEAAQAVLPDLDDRVTVVTEQLVYAVAWRDVARLDLSADAVVVDDDGHIVARIEDGRLIVSHDLLVGASISVD